MEYYTAFTKKEILRYVKTQRNLEGIMLTEIHQSQKDKYCILPLMWDTEIVESIESKSGMVVSGVVGGAWKWEITNH